MPKRLALADLWAHVRHWANTKTRSQHEPTILFVLTLLIGAIVGLLVVAFIVLTENLGARMYPAAGAAWRRLVIPVAGALITGFLLKRYFPDARGSGIPQTKTALFLRGGVIRFRTLLGKFICSSVSLASGIALGREGPSVQVGAGIASTLGRRLGLGPERIKSLVPIGASAALSAAFNTPIAAVLFTLEEVMGDLHAPVLGAIVLSSATSWMVLHLLLGDEPLFHVPAYQLVHPLEFLFYAALGILGGLVSVAFVKLLLWLRKRFLCLPRWTEQFQPVAGGLLAGVLGWFVPEVLGVGYSHVSQALNGQLAFTAMVMFVVLKLLATATCYASGNAGGIFGPSLFIGAMLGGAVGAGAHVLLPDYTGSVGAYALVGMGTAFAGIIRVPLTSVIMIFEVTRDYSIIVPLMVANLMSYFISSRLQEEPIYEALLHQDGIRLPPGARARQELVPVARAVRSPAQVLKASDEVERALANSSSEQSAWPVLDEHGLLLGMVTRAQLEQGVARERRYASIAEHVPPLDTDVPVTADNFPHVHRDDPLDTALARMARAGMDVLPVVSRDDVRKLVGTISLRDALAGYRHELEEKGSDSTYQESRTPEALLAGVVGVLIALVALAGLLSYLFREELSSRAQQHFDDGMGLVKRERYPEAIEQFRNALAVSHSNRDRLALAEALQKAGRSGEAEIYFRELLRFTPDSGPANLGLGRIAAERRSLEDAVNYFHRAIYGLWPEKTQAERIQARFELVKVLGEFGEKQQARAELIALTGEKRPSDDLEKHLGRLLLDYDLPREAREVFRKVLQKDDQDADAYNGLGQAEYALNNFRAAHQSFQNALRRNPFDSAVSNRIKATQQILDLNPATYELGAAERYRRSQKLVAAVLETLDKCIALMKDPPPASVKETVDVARKTLQRGGKPRSYADSIEKNLKFAVQLWKGRIDACGAPGDADDPITRLMTVLSSGAAMH
jgi:CIC family chloride channel protein